MQFRGVVSTWIIAQMLFCTYPAFASKQKTSVRRKVFLEQTYDQPFSGFSALSKYLYGGDPSFAKILINSNPELSAPIPADVTIRYPAPVYRVETGDTLGEISALWVGPGSHNFNRLCKLNPTVSFDQIRAKQTLILPRIPDAQEKERLLSLWLGINRKEPAPTSIQRPLPNKPTEVPSTRTPITSPFHPGDSAERLALVKWYLERLENKENRDRTNLMIADLRAHTDPKDWDAWYTIGQYFFKIGEFTEAHHGFSNALKSPDAPIQVGLLYLRSAAQAKVAISAKEKSSLFERFSALEQLLNGEQEGQ
ncbi:LysM domain-containing protein [Bdellovibrionota bacterium FG-1]